VDRGLFEGYGVGKIKEVRPVKLIVGMIAGREELFELSQTELSSKFGMIDYESEILPFVHTDYYEKEMGKHLKRRFVSFQKPFDPEKLAEIKLFTNQLEEKFSLEDNRQINLDPGYLSLSKLVLATTKDYSHRIYLREGIYAEVTLYYQDKTFKPYPWTYPDYKTKDYQEVFSQIRQIYLEQLRVKGSGLYFLLRRHDKESGKFYS